MMVRFFGLVEQRDPAADQQKGDGDKEKGEELDPGRGQVAPIEERTFAFPREGESQQQSGNSRGDECPVRGEPVAEQVGEKGVAHQPESEPNHRAFLLFEVEGMGGEQPSAHKPQQGGDEPGEEVQRITGAQPVHESGPFG